MRRELGAFESAQAWTGAACPYNVVAVLRLSGRPEAAAVETALAALQRRHPLLRARILRERGRWLFETAAVAVPLRRSERRGEEDWRTVVEEELGHRFEAGTAPLVRCRLVTDENDDTASELVLTLHHAVTDATAGVTLCRELLELCGGESSEAAADPAGGLPPAPDERFPDRFRGLGRYPRLLRFVASQLAEEAGYLWHSRGVRSAVPAGPVRCRVLATALGEGATDALILRARRERVPLNGAINAALLLAVQRHRYRGRPVSLRYFAFPDLRPYLRPAVGPETVASYLTVTRFTTRLGDAERLWELARRLSAQLHRSFKRGGKFLFCLTSPGLMRMLIKLGRMRMGTVALSYLGPVPMPTEIGPFRVRSLHAFVSNMRIGPEYTCHARLFRGRLWCDVVYLDGDMDEAGAAEIAGEALERLEAVAE